MFKEHIGKDKNRNAVSAYNDFIDNVYEKFKTDFFFSSYQAGGSVYVNGQGNLRQNDKVGEGEGPKYERGNAGSVENFETNEVKDNTNNF